MKELRDYGFGRIIYVSDEVVKNVDYNCGKVNGEWGEVVDGKVERNVC